MQLIRPAPPPRLISLVSMVDVLLIMLVFFMVTSTYLNLDMIPVAQTSDAPAQSAEDTANAPPLLVRLGADGVTYVRGQPLTLAALARLVAGNPERPVTILPALRADTQALVSVMDAATAAGAGRLRILQVAAP
ncbi:MAG: biopolymer transporter ExbD [Pseudomonadota bacterium]